MRENEREYVYVYVKERVRENEIEREKRDRLKKRNFQRQVKFVSFSFNCKLRTPCQMNNEWRTLFRQLLDFSG